MTVIHYLEFLTGLFDMQLTICTQLTNIYIDTNVHGYNGVCRRGGGAGVGNHREL